MTREFHQIPETDPTQLLRLRDSIYAADLLIAAVAWLDFFSWLSGNPSDLDQICSSLGLARRPADVMLTLFVAMGLVRKVHGKYYPSDRATEHLVKGAPWDLRPYYESMKERPICKDMLRVLKTGKPANWSSKAVGVDWNRAMRRASFARDFISAMDSRGAYLAPIMARTLNCSAYRALLDIGGGSGIYACAVLALNRRMKATVVEKPPVDKVARWSIAQKGMQHRIAVLGRDMFDELPHGFDIHLFSNVLHDWDEKSIGLLLKNSFAALSPGGMVAIHDAHLNQKKTGPLLVAEYSVLLMYSTEGRCYSIAEIRDILDETGFEHTEVAQTAARRSLITARKPR
ncbi:MAG: hypothetical protein A2Y95_00795 [Deltaproteobacteria bacterium RBG_13_65_10]|nr:MAG: hypothetical protein A2Y95_00795 [Deltaproteobacteria bacterium RBG_13_65_10]